MLFKNNELYIIKQALSVYYNLQKEILDKQIENRGSKAPFVNELVYVGHIEDLYKKVSKDVVNEGKKELFLRG